MGIFASQFFLFSNFRHPLRICVYVHIYVYARMYTVHINLGGSHGSSNRATEGARWRRRRRTRGLSESARCGARHRPCSSGRREPTLLARNVLLDCVTNTCLAQSERAVAHTMDLDAASHSGNVERVLRTGGARLYKAHDLETRSKYYME